MAFIFKPLNLFLKNEKTFVYRDAQWTKYINQSGNVASLVAFAAWRAENGAAFTEACSSRTLMPFHL